MAQVRPHVAVTASPASKCAPYRLGGYRLIHYVYLIAAVARVMTQCDCNFVRLHGVVAW
jgi:hypothetical protein